MSTVDNIFLLIILALIVSIGHVLAEINRINPEVVFDSLNADENDPQIELFHGNDEDSYFANFKEVSETKSPVHINFVEDLDPIRDLLKRRNVPKNLRRNQEIKSNALKADKFVTDLLKESEGLVGAKRNFMSSKLFLNPEENATMSVINEIASELKYVLIKFMEKRNCERPHPELLKFLNWILSDPCKKSKSGQKRQKSLRKKIDF